MKVSRPSFSSNYVILPSVATCMVWGGACGIGAAWALCTAEYPTIDEVSVLRLMSVEQGILGTVIHVALLAWLIHDWRRSRSSSLGLRRAHRAGVLLGVVLIALIQVGFVLAQGSLDGPPLQEATTTQGMNPNFPIVQGSYRMTSEWSLEAPKPLNRRFEGDHLVLWRPGFTVWILIWGNDNHKTPQERLSRIRQVVSPEAFSPSQAVEPSGLLRYSYRLTESRGEATVHALYGFKISSSGYVQAAFYFDDERDLALAGRVFDSIEFAPTAQGEDASER